MPTKFKVFLSLILFFYLILLAFLSLAPASTFSSGLLSFRGADKIVHAIIYTVPGFILFLILTDVASKANKRTIFIVFILTSAYGLLMEILQLTIVSSSRSFEWGDIIANCLGVIIGMFLAHLASYFIRKKFSPSLD